MNGTGHPSYPRRRYPLPILALVLALVLTLSWAVVSYAGRAGGWKATEFQVQNMDNETANFTAHFYRPDGSEALSFTDNIPPGRSVYYRPETDLGLPVDFTGTLRLESEQNIAGTIIHFAAQMDDFNGNDVFEMVPDDTTARTYFAPLIERNHGGSSSKILVGNLGPAPAAATIFIYNPDGTLASTRVLGPIPENGSASLNLKKVGNLGDQFIGSARIEADQPIWVDIVQVSSDRWAVYPATPTGDVELYAPVAADGVIPTIRVQNVSDIATTVWVCSAADCEDPVDLPPWGSRRIMPTHSWKNYYTITSPGGGPIAAVVSISDTVGASVYTALSWDQASTCQATPMLFDDYDDWDTTLWMYNPNADPVTVTVSFVGTSPLDSSAEIVQIAPGGTQSLGPDDVDVDTNYVAQISADQPVFALVTGTASDEDDGRFVYRATGFPSCPSTPIPTLTEWGYIVLAAFIVLVAAWTLRRRSLVAPVR